MTLQKLRLTVSTILIIYFAFFLFISCNDSKAEGDLSQIKNKIIYIEEHTKGVGNEAGDYGDVVMFDPDTKERYKLTDDLFYDEEPKISPDGQSILFQSNRGDSDLDRIIKGVGSSHKKCIMNLKTKTVKEIKIVCESELPEQMWGDIEHLQWSKDGAHMFFLAYKNKVCSCTPDGNNVKIIKDFSIDENNGFTNMMDMIVSKDNRYIAFRYDNQKWDKDNNLIDGKRGVAIYDIHKSRLKMIDIQYCTDLFCWTKDNKIMIREENKLFILDIYTSKKEMIMKGIKDIEILGCVMSDNNKLFLLASNCKADGGEVIDCGNPEIAQYNIKENKFEWLTDDGYYKDFLDVVTQDKY